MLMHLPKILTKVTMNNILLIFLFLIKTQLLLVPFLQEATKIFWIVVVKMCENVAYVKSICYKKLLLLLQQICHRWFRNLYAAMHSCTAVPCFRRVIYWHVEPRLACLFWTLRCIKNVRKFKHVLNCKQF